MSSDKFSDLPRDSFLPLGGLGGLEFLHSDLVAGYPRRPDTEEITLRITFNITTPMYLSIHRPCQELTSCRKLSSSRDDGPAARSQLPAAWQSPRGNQGWLEGQLRSSPSWSAPRSGRRRYRAAEVKYIVLTHLNTTYYTTNLRSFLSPFLELLGSESWPSLSSSFVLGKRVHLRDVKHIILIKVGGACENTPVRSFNLFLGENSYRDRVSLVRSL